MKLGLFRTLFAGVLMACLVFVGCSSDDAQVETVPPPETAPVPTMAPESPDADLTETTVEDYGSEPIVSEEVAEELPEDIKLLNSRGYLSDVFFDTDRYDLSAEGRDLLARNAAWLQEYPTVQILVEGHCDERNTREYNLALGERRANTVKDYLVFMGIAPQRIRTISYGEEKPFAKGSDEEAWRLNRRAHLVITAR